MRMGSEFTPARARVARAAAWHGEVLKRARTSAFVSTNIPSAAVGGYILGSSGQAAPVVVYLIPAHREAFRPWSGVPRRKIAVEIEPASSARIPKPLVRTGRVRKYQSVRVDVRFSCKPRRFLSKERMAVAGADFRNCPQRPMQSCRIRRAVAEYRFELAEGRPPLRFGANGEKMTGERRISVSGRYVDHEPVSHGDHEPYLEKTQFLRVSMGTLVVDRQRILRGREARIEDGDLPLIAPAAAGDRSTRCASASGRRRRQ